MKIINIKPITSKPLIALAILIIAVILVYFYYSFTSVSTDQDADFLAETSAVVVSSKPLKKGHAILHVTSEPDGAEIYLDKRLLGKTPFQSDDLPAGGMK